MGFLNGQSDKPKTDYSNINNNNNGKSNSISVAIFDSSEYNVSSTSNIDKQNKTVANGGQEAINESAGRSGKSEQTTSSTSEGFDVSRLCRAIAEHETHNCKDKTNSTVINNCHGFRVAGKFLPFKNKADSYAKCEKLWMSGAYSGGLPTLRDAKKWSGNDRAQTWQKNVTHFYYTL